MSKKIVRINLLHANVKGGAESIAREIAIFKHLDINIFFYFKEFSFYLFLNGNQRILSFKTIFSILYKKKVLIFSHFYHTHLIALILNLISLNKIGIILLIHSGIYKNTFSKLYFLYILFLGIFLRFLFITKLKIFYTSNYSRKSHIKYLWPRGNVIYFQMPLSDNYKTYLIHNLVKSDFVRIGFVGRYHPDKGIGLLKDILNNFNFELNPKFKFFLIIPNLPISNKFRIHNSINFLSKTDNIYSFLSQVDILLLPSQNESYPIIILEALNAGCKIIASDVGGIAENNSKQIKLISKYDAKYWIKQIVNINLLSLEKRKNIINRARGSNYLDYYINSLEKNL